MKSPQLTIDTCDYCRRDELVLVLGNEQPGVAASRICLERLSDLQQQFRGAVSEYNWLEAEARDCRPDKSNPALPMALVEYCARIKRAAMDRHNQDLIGWFRDIVETSNG